VKIQNVNRLQAEPAEAGRDRSFDVRSRVRRQDLGCDGEAVAGGGERFAHVTAVGLRLGKNQDLERAGFGRGGVKKGDVLGELFGDFKFVCDDEPDGGRMRADERREHGAASDRANTGELVARGGRFRHGRKLRMKKTGDRKSTEGFPQRL
jgi:hypothetical protein